MEKKSTKYVLIWAIVLSVFVNVFFGRWITAHVSTLPFLNRFNLLNPQAPIVITQRQEVRVADPGSLQEAMNKSRSKLSAVAIKQADGLLVIGGAVNLSSDGYFLTSSKIFGQNPPDEIFIVLFDGRAVKAEVSATDPATDLLVLKAEILGIQVAGFGASKDLAVGERVAILAGSLLSQSNVYYESVVSIRQGDFSGKEYIADRPSRAFALAIAELTAGSGVVNSRGEIVGLVTKESVISSDVIKKFVNIFFAQKDSVTRPSFGFSYRQMTDAESQSLDVAAGALVTLVTKSSPAAIAGLISRDTIVSVNGEVLSPDKNLEEILEKYSPGAEVVFKVRRKTQEVELTLKVGKQTL